MKIGHTVILNKGKSLEELKNVIESADSICCDRELSDTLYLVDNGRHPYGRTINLDVLKEKIDFLNNLKTNQDNYFSIHYGNTYFTLENARKIGAIREEINKIADNENEEAALITALLYANLCILLIR